MANIEEKVEKLILNNIENLGYSLYDVQYIKEGKDYFLRIFIDKEEGIDLEDCEKVSNSINDTLDEADYIKEQYFLEVSSPGIERILRKEKHFKDNIGKKVEVRLFKTIGKEKVKTGILENFNDKDITIQTEDGNIIIEKSDISVIKTVFDW